MGKYFGTDGFRGKANETLTAVHAFRVGRFLGHFYAGKKQEGRARIVVGKDTRRSSYMFEYALVAGATASGADVYLLHVTTTPSVSYVTRSERFDCGVMISASHNPFDDNGLKLVNSAGEKMEQEVIAQIEDYLDGTVDFPLATGADIGRTVDYVEGRNRYMGYLLSLARCSFRGWKVGLDCANGSAWTIAKAVFDALGAQTVLTGCAPDGSNINSECGSTHIENLQALVKSNALDIGFAFDGDADRCICVNERGEVVDGDGILYLCATYLRGVGELDSGVVATVMSNLGLSKALAARGISCALTRVGDKFVYAEMCKRGCSLGGEQSGHIIFRKYANTGDGILTAIQVMEALIESKTTLSRLTEGFIRFPQVLKNVRVKDRVVALNSAKLRSAVAEAESIVGEDGRVLVRPSGTEQVIRILAEAKSEERAFRAAKLIEEQII